MAAMGRDAPTNAITPTIKSAAINFAPLTVTSTQRKIKRVVAAAAAVAAVVAAAVGVKLSTAIH